MEEEIKEERVWIKLKREKLDAREVEQFTVQPDCGKGMKAYNNSRAGNFHEALFHLKFIHFIKK